MLLPNSIRVAQQQLTATERRRLTHSRHSETPNILLNAPRSFLATRGFLSGIKLLSKSNCFVFLKKLNQHAVFQQSNQSEVGVLRSLPLSHSSPVLPLTETIEGPEKMGGMSLVTLGVVYH